MSFESLKIVIISVISSLVASVIFVSVHSVVYREKHVIVHVDRILETHLEEMKKGDVDLNEKKGQLFAKSLENALREVSKEENLNIFVGRAVVAGLPDYTGVIEERIKKKMSVESENG